MTDASSNRLAVLTCDACGEPLAIGEADWVLCPGCGKRVVVPEPYRALRDASLESSAARARVEAFYRRLARRPRLRRWLVRRVGKERAWPIVATLLIIYALTLIVSPVVILWGGWQVGAVDRHVNVYQVLDPLGRGFVYACAVYVALVVPTLGFWVLGWNRRRRRALLTRGLAAARSTRDGAAACRECGSPLSVAPGHCSSTCIYCRAENLIVPGNEVIASATQKAVTLDDVIAEEEWQRRKVRRGLAGALFAPVLPALLMMLAVGFVAGEAYYPWDMGGSLRCAKPTCAEWRTSRLRRGQALDVELTGTAAGPPKLRLEGQAITPFPRSWITVDEAAIDDAGRARLVAPWDGWFRVFVEVPGPASADLRTN